MVYMFIIAARRQRGRCAGSRGGAWAAGEVREGISEVRERGNLYGRGNITLQACRLHPYTADSSPMRPFMDRGDV